MTNHTKETKSRSIRMSDDVWIRLKKLAETYYSWEHLIDNVLETYGVYDESSPEFKKKKRKSWNNISDIKTEDS